MRSHRLLPARTWDRDRDDLGLVMALNAGADSEATLSAQIRMAHQCAFWDSISPALGGRGDRDDDD